MAIQHSPVGRTEGIRPLGRLAYVDHLATIIEHLNDAFATATSDESRNSAELQTGLKFQSQSPRVIVLASISGGTGGGAALDLAYALRHVLRANDLGDDGLVGILTHATSRQHCPRDLATANAYAFLREMHHYCHPEISYVGKGSGTASRTITWHRSLSRDVSRASWRGPQP